MANRVLCVSILLLLVATAHADRSQWTRLRGPNGSGLSDATTIPVQWTDQDYNWKIHLPGIGHSSPVVWKNRIFLTCGDPETAGRMLLCVDVAEGRTLWQRDDPSSTYKQHRDSCYATATPAVDADGVVITWTTPEQIILLALDLDGREMWRRNLGPFIGVHGSGTSPIIVEDLVVLASDQEDLQRMARYMKEPPTGPPGESFLIAVDRKTGQTRWRLPRRTALAAYSTPCIHRRASGASELIFTSTAHGITAVDAGTGKVNWEIDDVFLDRCVGSPISAAGLVIAGYGYGRRGSLYVAVRPGLPNDGKKPEVVYEVKKSVPLVPTSLTKDGRLYLWGDDGVVSCLNVSTGAVIWRERVGGEFYGSPVCVDNCLYCIAKNGDVVVLAASDQFKVLNRVPLGEPSYATPAVSDGVMYLRTNSHLFSLGGAER